MLRLERRRFPGDSVRVRLYPRGECGLAMECEPSFRRRAGDG